MSIVLLVIVWMVVTYVATFKDEFDSETVQKGALFLAAIVLFVLLYIVLTSL